MDAGGGVEGDGDVDKRRYGWLIVIVPTKTTEDPEGGHQIVVNWDSEEIQEMVAGLTVGSIPMTMARRTPGRITIGHVMIDDPSSPRYPPSPLWD